MPVTVITPPVYEPVSESEVRLHLRIDGTDESFQISRWIVAAREHCEGFQRRAYCTQTLELTLDAWPDGREIVLPRPPLRAVTGVTYRDSDGNEHTFDPAKYVVATKSSPGQLVLAKGATWPTTELYPVEAISITYTAGYGASEDVPQRVKQAMLLLVGHWYENREATQSAMSRGEALPIPFGVESLLAPGRVRVWR